MRVKQVLRDASGVEKYSCETLGKELEE